MEKFINYFDVKLNTNKVGDFTLHPFQGHGLFWEGSKSVICASPNWDSEEGIVPIQILGNDEQSDGTHSIELGTPYDLEAQKIKYIKLITDIVNALEYKVNDDYNTLLDTILIFNK